MVVLLLSSTVFPAIVCEFSRSILVAATVRLLAAKFFPVSLAVFCASIVRFPIFSCCFSLVWPAAISPVESISFAFISTSFTALITPLFSNFSFWLRLIFSLLKIWPAWFFRFCPAIWTSFWAMIWPVWFSSDFACKFKLPLLPINPLFFSSSATFISRFSWPRFFMAPFRLLSSVVAVIFNLFPSISPAWFCRSFAKISLFPWLTRIPPVLSRFCSTLSFVSLLLPIMASLLLRFFVWIVRLPLVFMLPCWFSTVFSAVIVTSPWPLWFIWPAVLIISLAVSVRSCPLVSICPWLFWIVSLALIFTAFCPVWISLPWLLFIWVASTFNSPVFTTAWFLFVPWFENVPSAFIWALLFTSKVALSFRIFCLLLRLASFPAKVSALLISISPASSLKLPPAMFFPFNFAAVVAFMVKSPSPFNLPSWSFPAIKVPLAIILSALICPLLPAVILPLLIKVLFAVIWLSFPAINSPFSLVISLATRFKSFWATMFPAWFCNVVVARFILPLLPI